MFPVCISRQVDTRQCKPTENLSRPHKQEDDADAIEIDKIYFGSGEVKHVLHPVSKVPISHMHSAP